MTTWIALLRGINVGGRNKLSMKDLRALFVANGCENARTYIQSGNVVFYADIDDIGSFGDKVSEDIDNSHGFRPAIHLLTAETLQKAIAANPYPKAVAEPKTLHLNFLAERPTQEKVDAAKEHLSTTERFTLIDEHLYFHAPDGIGRSKFAGQVERLLGVSATGRNWNTITKLAELVGE